MPRFDDVVVDRPGEKRFWSRVRKSDGCWEWTGKPRRDRYGTIAVGPRGGKKDFLAHRFSWQLHYGEIPEGMEVCHTCDNPPCVRPDHLFLGTHKVNMSDMGKKGRRSWGEKHELHKLTTAQVRDIRELWDAARQNGRQRVPKGSPYSSTALGERYGVSETTIRDIIKGRTRSHE